MDRREIGQYPSSFHAACIRSIESVDGAISGPQQSPSPGSRSRCGLSGHHRSAREHGRYPSSGPVLHDSAISDHCANPLRSHEADHRALAVRFDDVGLAWFRRPTTRPLCVFCQSILCQYQQPRLRLQPLNAHARTSTRNRSLYCI